MLMAVRASGHSHIGGQVCPRPSPREDAQWLHCPRTRAAGNPPVPEEAGEIILISLCHLGTKGDRGDKKEGGTQHMGRGGSRCPMVGASKGAVPGSQVPKRRFAAALCKPWGSGGVPAALRFQVFTSTWSTGFQSHSPCPSGTER